MNNPRMAGISAYSLPRALLRFPTKPIHFLKGNAIVSNFTVATDNA